MLRSRLGRCAAIAAAALAVLIVAAPAAARTKWADIRVVTHTGRTLAEFRQYTGPTTVRASRKADCFGADNPSSGERYRLDGPNALGILKDALPSDRALRPLLISDAFVDDGFGLGVCSIGGFDTVDFSYWYLSVNREAASTGADLTPLHNGDDVLWYLTSGAESGLPRELSLRGPASAKPGRPFTVKALRFGADGKASAAAGVTVTADGKPVGRTGADGALAVRLPADATLQATGTKDDVTSNRIRVCVSADSGGCPDVRGAKVFGSEHGDRIKGTPGWDRIAARGGADVVNLRSGGQDRASCGGGHDEVVLEAGDRNDHIAPSCERVSRR
jgi:Domain of unknown function (DUF4430)